MKQKEALALLKKGHNVFITGAAGSGKTYTLAAFIRWAKKQKLQVAVTASTGIAATHLNGTTVHSWSGIKIHSSLSEKEMKKMLHKKYLREHIIHTDILVIDEISMLHAYQLDLINEVCKRFRKDVRPFGGLQIVMSGDFFQLPPIVRGGAGFGKDSFAVYSDAWKELNVSVCYLTEQHRHTEKAFFELLNNIRQQNITHNDITLLKDRVGALLPDDIPPVKIYTHTVDVDLLNARELSTIPEELVSFSMKHCGPKGLVEQLQKHCLAPETLQLKKGATVMFVKNNFDAGYINGTMGIVEDFDEDLKPLVRTAEGDLITVEPASWTIDDQDDVVAEIKQLPVRLAWAITVHKSQGMSLDRSEIDLSKSFEFGMGYVALSRVRSLKGLRLLGFNRMSLRVDPFVSKLDQSFQKQSKALTSKHKKVKKT